MMQCMAESCKQEHLVLHESMEAAVYDLYADYEINNHHPVLLVSQAELDTMYLDQALKAADKAEFIKAMVEEVKLQTKNGHWQIIPVEDVPHGHEVLPAAWAMKHKHQIKTQEVYKWKVRLNLHGGMQTYGVNFWETYAPVVLWPTIQLMLILASIHEWHTCQIDFLLAYPQANIECKMYMLIPHGFHVCSTGSTKTHVLKHIKNIYGSKQAGKVWNNHMNERMTSDKIGFTCSKFDPCVYYYNMVIFMVYVDDGIFARSELNQIEEAKSCVQQCFNITD